MIDLRRMCDCVMMSCVNIPTSADFYIYLVFLANLTKFADLPNFGVKHIPPSHKPKPQRGS
jgi:hypothetical protein